MATIEIDGKKLEADNGKMIIEVADDAGIHIPRFCYHKKLSVAANCRMCLVEVENGRKPVPACATPITNGMKVFTKSEEAIRSQKAVMEFLLINHPLDCPICDQGGECELQDVSMGFGGDESEYSESKRSVDGDNLGTLIETEMTRCIHCTRCVRFGDEVAGVRELGATGRGEQTEIGTYVKHSMTSEVSGNIIDLCPVGALTSKPYRYTARPWELTQLDGIAPHDCLGSNLHFHVRRNELMRVVPKENEQLNETWLSDRDRFSYLGLKSKERLSRPLIKREGQWEEVNWETALTFAAKGIAKVIKQHGPEQFAAFSSASATLEELYLLQKLMREIGVNNLDYRLQQSDSSDEKFAACFPKSPLPVAEIEKQDALLLVGCNIHREVPLAGIRVRKASRNGASIFAINPVDYDYHFEVKASKVVAPTEMTWQLAAIVKSLVSNKQELPESAQKLIIGIEPDAEARHIASALREGKGAIITGALVENHPHAALIRTLVTLIEQLSGSQTLRLTPGSNAAGAAIAGMLPDSGPAFRTIEHPGLHAKDAISNKLKGYFLLGVEADYDFANPFLVRQAMHASEFVVVTSAFANESVQDYADVILPAAPFAETSGTYINCEGLWQTSKGALQPHGEARPAWKILRVIANLLDCNGFDFVSSAEVLDEIRTCFDVSQPKAYEPTYSEALPETNHGIVRVGEWPLYQSDAIVRHAKALQACAASDSACVRVHPQTAERLKLGESATISQNDIEITLPLKRDSRVAPDIVWVPNAMPETVDLGDSFGTINIKR